MHKKPPSERSSSHTRSKSTPNLDFELAYKIYKPLGFNHNTIIMKLLALFGLLFSVSMVPGAVAPFTALLGLEGAVAGVLVGYVRGAVVDFITMGVGLAAGHGKLSVPQVKKARDGDEEANVDIHLPPGVPQYVLDMCAQELVKSKVVIDQHPDYSLRLNGVPPTCMNLAVLFAEQGRPIPCGSACLDYKGLSDSDLKSIIEFFNSHM